MLYHRLNDEGIVCIRARMLQKEFIMAYSTALLLVITLLTGCAMTKQTGGCVEVSHTECSSHGMAYVTTISL